MRKLKTPEELMNEDPEDVRSKVYYSDDVHEMIIAAQRDALECAAENVKVYANRVKEYHQGKIVHGYKIDKASILNLVPKEI